MDKKYIIINQHKLEFTYFGILTKEIYHNKSIYLKDVYRFYTVNENSSLFLKAKYGPFENNKNIIITKQEGPIPELKLTDVSTYYQCTEESIENFMKFFKEN